jgi:hypothetical protein
MRLHINWWCVNFHGLWRPPPLGIPSLTARSEDPMGQVKPVYLTFCESVA